jgi:hypothetical protein
MYYGRAMQEQLPRHGGTEEKIENIKDKMIKKETLF